MAKGRRLYASPPPALKHGAVPFRVGETLSAALYHLGLADKLLGVQRDVAEKCNCASCLQVVAMSEEIRKASDAMRALRPVAKVNQ